jgi:hypothetical protein
LQWFSSYFHKRSISVQNGKHTSAPRTINRGTPQGSSLSGLLFTVYVNYLPDILKNCQVILYADDLVMWVSLKSINAVRTALQEDLYLLEQWCENNFMEINVNKTKTMTITPTKTRVAETLNIKTIRETIEEVDNFKYLGLTIDKHLTWNIQYEEVCQKMSQRMFLINRHKKCVNQKWLQIFCTSLVISVLDYCYIRVAWGNLSQCKYKRMDSLMFKAAKLIIPQQKYNKNNRMDLFDRVNWLNSAERFQLYSLVYAHKHMSNETSLTNSLKQFFIKIPESDRNTRSTDCFTLPRMNTDGKNSFFYETIKMWNYLPVEVRLNRLNCLKVRSEISY